MPKPQTLNPKPLNPTPYSTHIVTLMVTLIDTVTAARIDLEHPATEVGEAESLKAKQLRRGAQQEAPAVS